MSAIETLRQNAISECLFKIRDRISGMFLECGGVKMFTALPKEDKDALRERWKLPKPAAKAS